MRIDSRAAKIDGWTLRMDLISVSWNLVRQVHATVPPVRFVPRTTLNGITGATIVNLFAVYVLELCAAVVFPCAREAVFARAGDARVLVRVVLAACAGRDQSTRGAIAVARVTRVVLDANLRPGRARGHRARRVAVAVAGVACDSRVVGAEVVGTWTEARWVCRRRPVAPINASRDVVEVHHPAVRRGFAIRLRQAAAFASATEVPLVVGNGVRDPAE